MDIMSDLEKNSKRKYEAIFILKNNDKEVIQQTTVRIQEILTNNQSDILSKEEWGEKELFNNKYLKGYFFYVVFSSVPDIIVKIIKEWNVNYNIIKYTFMRK